MYSGTDVIHDTLQVVCTVILVSCATQEMCPWTRPMTTTTSRSKGVPRLSILLMNAAAFTRRILQEVLQIRMTEESKMEVTAVFLTRSTELQTPNTRDM